MSFVLLFVLVVGLFVNVIEVEIEVVVCDVLFMVL